MRNEIQPDIPTNNFSPLFGTFIGSNGLWTYLHLNSPLSYKIISVGISA